MSPLSRGHSADEKLTPHSPPPQFHAIHYAIRLQGGLPCPTPHSADLNSRSSCAPDSPRWACSSTHTVQPLPSNSPTVATTGYSSIRSTAPWATKNFPPWCAE